MLLVLYHLLPYLKCPENMRNSMTFVFTGTDSDHTWEFCVSGRQWVTKIIDKVGRELQNQKVEGLFHNYWSTLLLCLPWTQVIKLPAKRFTPAFRSNLEHRDGESHRICIWLKKKKARNFIIILIKCTSLKVHHWASFSMLQGPIIQRPFVSQGRLAREDKRTTLSGLSSHQDSTEKTDGFHLLSLRDILISLSESRFQMLWSLLSRLKGTIVISVL